MSLLGSPITRYYGSKRKLVNRIWESLETQIQFNSFLDLFGGSASVSYLAKTKGKQVIYNDLFKFNYYIGKALIEESNTQLTENEVLTLLKPKSEFNYRSVIERNFKGIYYPDSENEQIDLIVQNIEMLENDNKKAGAYYMLFQACIIKRPYNLFHRNNLNLRTNFNGGNFGNKVTWERSFEELFLKFYAELKAYTFDNGMQNKAINFSALQCPEHADLVYIDPPYFHPRNHVPYHSKYHFLEGLAHYDEIENNINQLSRNKEIIINKSKEFESKANFLHDLNLLLAMHQNSAIAISYRSNGIPTIEEISNTLAVYKNNVHAVNLGNYGYALNRSNSDNYEYLILGY